MNRERKMRILLPGGEWLPNFMEAMDTAGFPLKKQTKRRLLWNLDDERQASLPIEFVEVRASDVPETISNTKLPIKAGFTGSDIAIENRLVGSESLQSMWQVPLADLTKNPIKPRLV